MDTGLVMFHIVTNTFKKSQLSLFPQNRLQLYKRTSLAVHLQFPTMYEDLHSYLSSSNSFSYSCLQYQQTFSGRKIGIAEQGNNPQLQQIPPTKPIGHTYQKKKTGRLSADLLFSDVGCPSVYVLHLSVDE